MRTKGGLCKDMYTRRRRMEGALLVSTRSCSLMCLHVLHAVPARRPDAFVCVPDGVGSQGVGPPMLRYVIRCCSQRMW